MKQYSIILHHFETKAVWLEYTDQPKKNFKKRHPLYYKWAINFVVISDIHTKFWHKEAVVDSQKVAKQIIIIIIFC